MQVCNVMPLYNAFEALNIGPRLQAIADIILTQQCINHYDVVWDCCCDHGYLGIHLLNEKLAAKVYFVDQVPHIMQRLTPKLSDYNDDQYSVYCTDVAKITLNPIQRHVLVLAGISAKNIIGIMEDIRQRYPHVSLDFILCPTNAIYNLRGYLHQRKNDISLLSEHFVSEKNRHYEIIHISSYSTGGNVSLTGLQWQQENIVHREYLSKLILHFERESQGEGRSRSKANLHQYKLTYTNIFE